MEASEAPPRRGGTSGGAGIVAGLLLIGLLLMGLAMGISFAINAQHQAELEASQREEHAKRVEAEQAEAAAEARAQAEHERALAAEKAHAEHEARQIEALHAEELARARTGAPEQAAGSGPPDLALGKSVLLLQGAKSTTGQVIALTGPWVQLELRSGTRIWFNFLRVDRYEILP
jgi:sRNA-binding protein